MRERDRGRETDEQTDREEGVGERVGWGGGRKTERGRGCVYFFSTLVVVVSPDFACKRVPFVFL